MSQYNPQEEGCCGFTNCGFLENGLESLCNPLVEDVSLDEIRSHLTQCEECTGFLSDVFKCYKNHHEKGDPEHFVTYRLKDLPVGIKDVDQFLNTLHEFLHQEYMIRIGLWDNIFQKLRTDPGTARALERFLSIQARILWFVFHNRNLFPGQKERLRESFQNLRQALGPDEFALFLDLRLEDGEDSQDVLRGWDKLLATVKTLGE